MKKINYPAGIEDEYLQIFSDDEIKTFQQDWDNNKRNLYKNELKPFPANVKDILTASFEELTDFYLAFRLISTNISTTKRVTRTKKDGTQITEDEEIFNYDYFRNKIAEFFIEHDSPMGITSCFYCDAHPIGKFLKAKEKRRSFDIDHFYPQNECPILALSLKNFVPSCQVCNSRIKGKTALFDFYRLQNLNDSERKNTLCKIFPTSKDYNFNENVFIRVLPKNGFDKKVSFLDNMSSYEINFDATDDYKHETEAFCLSQRYNSVTILAEALSLLDLKKKFPLAKMKEIQDLLNANGTQYVTFDEIEETIFHKKFDKERKAPLLKLKQDILE